MFRHVTGHLQVVHDILSKQLYGAIMDCIQWYSTGGEVGTRSRMCLEVGRCGYVGVLLLYVMSKLI